MSGVLTSNKIKKVAFIYLTQGSGGYTIAKDPGYGVQKRPQLGLQYLCAILEKKGIKTDIFDQTVSFFDIDWLIERLKGYDLAGFYCSDPQEEEVKNFCSGIKEKLNVPILVGGPSAFTNASFLEFGCNIVVHGEGEVTLEHIVDYYNGQRDLAAIRGISYKVNGQVVTAPPQELIKELDNLPFPDRSKIDINEYYDYFLFGMQRPYITMIASRGCLYRCSYCVSCNMWGNKYRKRSVDNVLAEIDNAVEKYRIKYIAFQDDVFGVSNDWVEEFCEKLIKRSYRVKWMAIFHPFSLRNDTEKILRLMRKAGCDTLSFGLQSAHPLILKNINRHPDEPAALKKLLRLAQKADFITSVGYIFGLPEDTRETIKATMDYSVTSGATLSMFFILSVLRGSDLEKLYRDKKPCELSEDLIEKLTVYASRKFYTRPENILRIAYFIARNPWWLVRRGLYMPSVLARIGFGSSVRVKGNNL